MAPQSNLDVLHLIGSLAVGGAERNLYYLAPAMARSRLKYGICCLMERGEFAAEIESLGIPVFALGYRRRSAPLTIVRLARLLKRRRVRVLHTHLYECGVIGRIAGWLARVPVIITHEHGKTTWKKWYDRWFERVAVRGTDLRIAVSDDIRNIRIEREHTPPEKITVVANAVDASRFQTSDQDRQAARRERGLGSSFVIGTIGRLVVAKSYDLLLEVARDVCLARPDARFLIVGDGPLREALVARRDGLGLAGKVDFLGSRTDIPKILSAIDLYVITSQREGLPITLLEAMMAAKPIVATGIGGIPDVISSGENGVVVPTGDRAALAKAILGLADDPGRRTAMGERARRAAVERYSAEAILETLEATYAFILKNKGFSTNPL